MLKGKNVRRERASRHGHRPQQSRSETLPEPTESLRSERLPEAVRHAAELLLRTEPVALHLALDDIERVAGNPERLAGETAVGSNPDAGNVLAPDVVALGVLVHEVLEGQEPHAVRLGFSVDGDHLSPEEAAQDALVGGQLADAVERPVVQPLSSMWLRLQADTDMLDGSREHRVGDTGEGSSEVILRVGQTSIGRRLLRVDFLETSPCLMEGTELNADLRQFLALEIQIDTQHK